MSKHLLIEVLEGLCKEAGLELECKSWTAGHFHIKGGALLVNYYPFSKKKVAYVAGTTKGRPATMEEAIAMAGNPPNVVRFKERDKRDGRESRDIRRRLLGPSGVGKCCWCGCAIDLETSSIEHVVPLVRGGLENANNRKLACRPCNDARGGDMPELEKEDPPWSLP